MPLYPTCCGADASGTIWPTFTPIRRHNPASVLVFRNIGGAGSNGTESLIQPSSSPPSLGSQAAERVDVLEAK
jgi:hypothetical protein